MDGNVDPTGLAPPRDDPAVTTGGRLSAGFARFANGLIIFLSIGLNLAIFAGAVAGRLPVVTYIAVHAVTMAALAYALWCPPRGSRRNNYLMFLWAVSIPTGGVGLAIAMLAWPCHIVFVKRAQPFAQWYLTLFPETEKNPDTAAVGSASPGQSEGVQSFHDVIRYGSHDDKSTALSLIARRFDPAFLPVLQSFLGDANPAVRVEAAAVYARLHDRFADRTAAIERSAADDPDGYEVHRRLAEIYDAWAWSGMGDLDETEAIRQEALDHWLRCHAMKPDAASVHALGRLLVRARRYEEAIELLRDVVTGGEVPPEMGAWYMEALFELGRYDEVHKTAAHLRRIEEGRAASAEGRGRDLMRLWHGDGPASGAAHA